MLVTSGSFFMELIKLKLPKSVKGVNNLLTESYGAVFVWLRWVFFVFVFVFAKLTKVGYF